MDLKWFYVRNMLTVYVRNTKANVFKVAKVNVHIQVDTGSNELEMDDNIAVV